MSLSILTPRQWIEKADSDLRSANILAHAKPPETDAATFHAQQAGEKYLKAFLAYQGQNPPKEHNLEKLLELVLPFESSVDALRPQAKRLTPFAVQVRYPFTGPSPSIEEAQTALHDAENIKQATLFL